MRSIKTMAVLAACLALAQFLVACGSSGIRNLSEVETKYFRDLNTKLKESDGKMKGLLEGPTAVNEETALRQIALLDGNIRRAKLVYSVRENQWGQLSIFDLLSAPVKSASLPSSRNFRGLWDALTI